MFRALGGHHASQLTATAGTAITCLIPPRRGAFTRLTRILYRCAGTAHTVTALKALWQTTLASAIAASGTSATLAADNGAGTSAGALASNDWIAIQLDDGNYFLSTLASLSTLTGTVSALPSAAAAGNKVFVFGVPGDHTSSQTTAKPNPVDGSQFLCTASILNDWGDYASGICQTLSQEEPLMVHSNNATAAGTFELIAASHTMN